MIPARLPGQRSTAEAGPQPLSLSQPRLLNRRMRRRLESRQRAPAHSSLSAVCSHSTRQHHRRQSAKAVSRAAWSHAPRRAARPLCYSPPISNSTMDSAMTAMPAKRLPLT